MVAAKGKRRRADAARFLLDLEPECFRLAAELKAGQWRPGPYHTFTIREPKSRLISAAPFRDRVVHHALVALMEPHFERRFVAHSYACRRGKGTHRALARARSLSRSRRFVLKGDIAKFFPSIDHQILKATVRRVIADEPLLAVLDLIIDGSNAQEGEQAWFPGDDLYTPLERRKGIPIGNLTSQFLANAYLDPFDHFIMDQLGYGGFVRYCDDFLVFADSRAELWALRDMARAFLASMRLTLHEKKGGVHSTRSPLPFLGFVVRHGQQTLQRAGLVRATRRLSKAATDLEVGALTPEQFHARLAAWEGHACHARGQGVGVIASVLARSGCDRLVGAVS